MGTSSADASTCIPGITMNTIACAANTIAVYSWEPTFLNTIAPPTLPSELNQSTS